MKLALWQRFWLLLSGIWVLVCVLNAFTILAFAEGEEARAWQPALLAVAVPAAAYAGLWLYFRLRAR
jgi:hypothetical protein